MKSIPRPQLESARTLSPAEMNTVHFDKKHTVLTPELLEAMAKAKTDSPNLKAK